MHSLCCSVTDTVCTDGGHGDLELMGKLLLRPSQLINKALERVEGFDHTLHSLTTVTVCVCVGGGGGVATVHGRRSSTRNLSLNIKYY